MRQKSLGLTALFLWLLPLAGQSQDLGLEGTWACGAVVTAGISGGDSDLIDRNLRGRQVRVDGKALILPDGTRCEMTGRKAETWLNDTETFGSGGGDWSDLGLVSVDGDFSVQTRDLACGGEVLDPVQLIYQPASGVVLLDLRDRNFVPLGRLAGS